MSFDDACARAAALVEEGDRCFDARELALACRAWTEAADLLLPLLGQAAGMPEQCVATASLSQWRLAHLAEQGGDPRSAAALYARAFEINAQALPPGQIAFFARAAGRNHHQAGNYDGALDYAQRAHEIDRALDPESAQSARDLNGIAHAHLGKGELGAALQVFQEALVIFEKGDPEGDETATVLNNLGQTYWKRGDPKRGLDYHRRALQIDEARDPASADTATSLNNVGLMYKTLGDLMQAELHYQRALELDEARDPWSMATARDLNNLGKVERASSELTGNPKARRREREYMARALEIIEAVAPGSHEHALVLDSIGDVHDDEGDLVAAGEVYARANRLVEDMAPRSDLAATLQLNLANVARKRGDLDEAIDAYAMCIATADWLRFNVGGPEPGEELFSRYQEPYQAIISCLFERGGSGDHLLALQYAERSRARTLMELVGARALDPGASVEDSTLQRRERDLVREVGQLYNTLETARANTYVAGLPTTWALIDDPVREEMQALEHELAVVRARLWAARAQGADPASLQQAEVTAQQAVPPGSLRLVYATHEERTFVWALTAEGLTMVQNETSAAELAELVAAAIGDYDFPGQSRGGVPAPPNPERADERAQARTELSRRLIDPIPSSIWRGAKRLVVVPDGPLHRLPFELLSREGVLLADDLALSYAPSLSALDVLRRNGPPERDPSHLFIGFGDPAFEDRWHPLAEGAGGAPTQFARRGLTLPELPATRAEVESAAEIFAPAATTFCGAEATEQSVKSFVEPYAYIHFATHGLLDDEAPLYSGLALAPPRSDESPGDQGPDDFLQVFEIFDLRLSADVVVCSACQTGAGRYLAGEGLIGMTRAFFVAGARNLVVSLWPVPDLLTAKLMQAFYGFLRDGSPVDEALRRAKAGVRRRHPDPYYWAAFITLGAGAAES